MNGNKELIGKSRDRHRRRAQYRPRDCAGAGGRRGVHCGQCAQQSRRGRGGRARDRGWGGKALVHIGDVADAAGGAGDGGRGGKAFRPHRHPCQQCGAAAGKVVRRDELRRMARNPDVTLDGTFHCAKACLPALRQERRGNHRQYRRLERPYRRERSRPCRDREGGIVGFTRALAHDLAADGITVNCVVPGLIGTPRPKDKPEPAHHLTHQHHHRRARQAGGCRGHGPVPVQPGGALYQRTGDPRQWRGLSRRMMHGVLLFSQALPDKCARLPRF